MTFTTPIQSCTPRKPRSTALTRAAALLVLAAGLLGGCAREFPEVPMSAADAKFAKDLAGQTDPDSRLAYGKLMFMHNHIDEADAALAPLSKAEPDNAEALAWRAANDCKIAGRRGPWLMGLDKLWLVRNCLDPGCETPHASPSGSRSASRAPSHRRTRGPIAHARCSRDRPVRWSSGRHE